MKFTNEQILESIKTTLGEERQISDRTISESLATMVPSFADDETELAAFIEKVMPIFKSMDGNIRHNVSEKYKQTPPPTPAPPKPEEKPPKPEEAPPKPAENELLAKILEGQKQLNTLLEKQASEIKEMKDKEQLTQSKTTIITKANGIYTKEVVDTVEEGFDFMSDKAEDKFLEKCKGLATRFGAPIKDGSGNDPNGAKTPIAQWAEKNAKKVIDEQKEEERIRKEMGIV